MISADDMILYVENPKEFTKNFIINRINKVPRYKIKTQKSVAFLYTSSK